MKAKKSARRAKLSPAEARTEKQVCSLQCDNIHVRNGWILLNGGSVVLVNQRRGEIATGRVEFSRREFEKLARWYLEPQDTADPTTGGDT